VADATLASGTGLALGLCTGLLDAAVEAAEEVVVSRCFAAQKLVVAPGAEPAVEFTSGTLEPKATCGVRCLFGNLASEAGHDEAVDTTPLTVVGQVAEPPGCLPRGRPLVTAAESLPQTVCSIGLWSMVPGPCFLESGPWAEAEDTRFGAAFGSVPQVVRHAALSCSMASAPCASSCATAERPSTLASCALASSNSPWSRVFNSFSEACAAERSTATDSAADSSARSSDASVSNLHRSTFSRFRAAELATSSARSMSTPGAEELLAELMRLVLQRPAAADDEAPAVEISPGCSSFAEEGLPGECAAVGAKDSFTTCSRRAKESISKASQRCMSAAITESCRDTTSFKRSRSMASDATAKSCIGPGSLSKSTRTREPPPVSLSEKAGDPTPGIGCCGSLGSAATGTPRPHPAVEEPEESDRRWIGDSELAKNTADDAPAPAPASASPLPPTQLAQLTTAGAGGCEIELVRRCSETPEALLFSGRGGVGFTTSAKTCRACADICSVGVLEPALPGGGGGAGVAGVGGGGGATNKFVAGGGDGGVGAEGACCRGVAEPSASSADDSVDAVTELAFASAKGDPSRQWDMRARHSQSGSTRSLSFPTQRSQ